jgi:hypothetical protein
LSNFAILFCEKPFLLQSNAEQIPQIVKKLGWFLTIFKFGNGSFGEKKRLTAQI